MAKKEKPPVPAAPAVNPEILEVEKAYRKDVRITESAPKIRSALYLVWASIDILLLAIFFIYLGVYLTIGSFSERRYISRIGTDIDTQNAVTEANAALPLLIGNGLSFDVGENQYDLYVEVENPNDDWYATFDYSFTDGNQTTQTEHGFILPKEKRSLVSFRQSFDRRPSRPLFLVENIEWQRVNHHEIADLETWVSDHDRFSVTDTSYGFAQEEGTDQFGRSTFTIANDTPFSYRDAVFLVFIRDGNTLLGINQVTIDALNSGDRQTFSINWFDHPPVTGSVLVVPHIDYFDPDVYAAPQAGTPIDTRTQF